MKLLSSGKRMRSSVMMKIISGLVIMILIAAALLSTRMGGLESNADALTPGTPEYYQVRWNEAKEKANTIRVGTFYRNYEGKAAIVAAEGPWNLNLNYSTCSTPWNGAAAGTIPNNGGNGTVGSPYLVSTAEQFRYCMVNAKSFKLLNDIDMGGYMGRNWQLINTWTTEVLCDGNGFTVYNLNFDYAGTADASLFHNPTVKTTLRDFRLANAKLLASGNVGSFSIMFTYGAPGEIIIENCAIEDTTIENAAGHRAAGFLANCMRVTMTKTYTRNVHIFGGSCSGQLAGYAAAGTYTDCFSVEGTVISGGHGGGVFGCIVGVNATRVFADVEEYGLQACGTFAGPIRTGSGIFTDCYSSGKIEGTDRIGGFIAGNEGSSTPTIDAYATINRCYNTAMVGAMAGATKMGGFTASMYMPLVPEIEATIKTSTINDSYAAGEVGSIDIDSSANRTANRDVGGFAADASKAVFSNGYYDKQTTAMREWITGTQTSVAGVKGVLTTDTNKSGTGLVSAPGSNGSGSQSFTGFSNNSFWVFEEGHYPQLKVFAEPTTFTNTNWMTQQEMNNLVKAYSRSSTATVQLETWETNYNGTALGPAVYDTVRDLTLEFPLTSNSQTEWQTDGVTTSLWGDTVNILELVQSSGGIWHGKDFAPGVEWLTVKHQEGNQSGTRRLRIVPTAALDAGSGKTLTRGNTYDHADDVRLAYSTGPRMDKSSTDITTGVFPDNPLNAYQQAAQQALTGSVLANFNAAADFYKNVYAGHLTKSGTSDNSTNSKIDVYIYKDAAIDPVTGAVVNGAAVGIDNNKNSGANALNNQKFNGHEAFPETADSRYFIDYVWNLQDGRYMQNGKMIYVKGSPYNVDIEAVNPDQSPNSSGLYLSASDPAGPNFGTAPRASDHIDRIAGAQARTSWKTSSRKVMITKLTLQTTYDDEGNWGNPVTIENPKTGDTITVKRLFQRRIMLEDGGYYTQDVIVDKTYTIMEGTQAGTGEKYYYLEFTKTDTVSGVPLNDVEDDIKVTLTVENLKTDLEIHKHLESAAEEEETFTFQLDYQGDGTTPGKSEQVMFAVITIPAGQTTGKVVFSSVDIGWYRVTEMDSNWRFELVGSKLAEDNPDAAEIDEKNGTIMLSAEKGAVGIYTFRNKRRDIPWVNGKNRITNEMPKAD